MRRSTILHSNDRPHTPPCLPLLTYSICSRSSSTPVIVPSIPINFNPKALSTSRLSILAVCISSSIFLPALAPIRGILLKVSQIIQLVGRPGREMLVESLPQRAFYQRSVVPAQIKLSALVFCRRDKATKTLIIKLNHIFYTKRQSLITIKSPSLQIFLMGDSNSTEILSRRDSLNIPSLCFFSLWQSQVSCHIRCAKCSTKTVLLATTAIGPAPGIK